MVTLRDPLKSYSGSCKKMVKPGLLGGMDKFPYPVLQNIVSGYQITFRSESYVRDTYPCPSLSASRSPGPPSQSDRQVQNWCGTSGKPDDSPSSKATLVLFRSRRSRGSGYKMPQRHRLSAVVGGEEALETRLLEQLCVVDSGN